MYHSEHFVKIQLSLYCHKRDLLLVSNYRFCVLSFSLFPENYLKNKNHGKNGVKFHVYIKLITAVLLSHSMSMQRGKSR